MTFETNPSPDACRLIALLRMVQAVDAGEVMRDFTSAPMSNEQQLLPANAPPLRDRKGKPLPVKWQCAVHQMCGPWYCRSTVAHTTSTRFGWDEPRNMFFLHRRGTLLALCPQCAILLRKGELELRQAERHLVGRYDLDAESRHDLALYELLRELRGEIYDFRVYMTALHETHEEAMLCQAAK